MAHRISLGPGLDHKYGQKRQASDHSHERNSGDGGAFAPGLFGEMNFFI